MDELRRGWRLGVFLLLTGLFVGCRSRSSDESIPDARLTVEKIGRRLSASISERRLTSLSTRGAELLSYLKRDERDALGRGYLRFRVDEPITLFLAVPATSIPFWVADQGFESTDQILENEDTRWVLFRRDYPAGTIGLGVNGLDRSPSAHYASFLARSSSGPALAPDEVELDGLCASTWRKIVADHKVSPAQDVYRPFRNIPKVLEGTILLQSRHDQRHSTLLATGRVWKTHSPSKKQPDQVTISFGNDPARELSWSWRTSPEVTENVLRIVPARFESAENESLLDPDLSNVRIVRSVSVSVRDRNLLNDPEIRRHVVTLTDLTPDSAYLYSLGDGTSEGWSPWRNVRTGPDQMRRIEFLYLGDAQTGLEQWGRRLGLALRRHPGIDFFLMAGDLVDRGNERTNWDHFFLRACEILDRVPVMPCVGNHEYLDQGPRHYRDFFRLPQNGPRGIDTGLVYHFRYGDVFIAVLDSTLAVTSPARRELQAAWLDESLARSDATWKLVMFHHPVYASHTSRQYPMLADSWAPIFDKHHVDLVLQGHDHAYLRTYPLRSGRPVSDPARGTIYVVSVSGDKFCEQDPRGLGEVGFTHTSTYQTIEVDPHTNRLTFRAWTDDGNVADRFVISKPRSPVSREIARDPGKLRMR